MWPFRKKQTLEESGFFQGFTDWHSHILPGVDDGVQTMEESLQILAEYERLGVKKVWLTPHIMEDIPNTTAQLKERFAALQQAYRGSAHLHLAAEYMLDRQFEMRLQGLDLLPIGVDSNWLLVETSCFNPPVCMESLLREIWKYGYEPLLAHPERYTYLNSKEDYRNLKSQGVRFQLNLPSLAGAYGPAAREKAVWLLRKGYYDVAGTDTHGLHAFQHAVLQKQLSGNISRCLFKWKLLEV